MNLKPNHISQYFSLLAEIRREKYSSNFQLIVIYGKNEFLQQRAAQTVQKIFQDIYNGKSHSFEAAKLDQDSMEPLWQQQDLFNPVTQYILRRAEKAKSLAQLLKLIPDSDQIKNKIVFLFSSQAINPRIKKEFSRLSAIFLNCSDPSAFEAFKLIDVLCKESNLRLTNQAIQFLIETQGHDLFKLQNALNILALIYPTNQHALDLSHISPYIGMNHTDHLFKLEQYIIEGKQSRSVLFAHTLIDKGEQALALVGFIATIFRKALKIQNLLDQGFSTSAIAQKTRLPPRVVQRYTSFSLISDQRALKKILELCRMADVALKSSAANPKLLITELLQVCHPSDI